MKIILTATSPSIDSNVDPRFGRGAYFLIVDPDTLEWQAYPNPGVGAPGGAGTLAAQFVANQHVEASHQRRFRTQCLWRAPGCRHRHVSIWNKHHPARRLSSASRQGSSNAFGAPTGQGPHPRG